MRQEPPSDTGGLSPLYQHYEHQKCFIGLSHGAQWREEIVSTCDEVLPLPGFDLEPWYADHYYDPTKPLLDIVVEMIANARYGIYDLSYWHKDETNEWIMPRNVFIELGIAIALNRPTLLLQHGESQQKGPKLPECLESIRDRILPFTGNYTLKKALEDRLPQWVNAPPEQEWLNLYCLFGDRRCVYRKAHPRARHWTHGPLPCHISHGSDRDQKDFRSTIERVLKDYNDIQASYLNELSLDEGYKFLLCTHCQKVRSTPFTIHRITPETPAEAFIAIGISIALEAQFNYKIPKVLLAAKMEDVPSLLAGHKVVIAKDNLERKKRLQEFLPQVYQSVRTTTWRSRPLPFIEVMPRQSEKPAVSQKSQEEISADEAKAYNDQGNAYHAEKRYDDALAAYELAIQHAPTAAHYHYNKALTLYNLNRYKEALVVYEQAIQIAPDYGLAYGGRGRAYSALKDYQAATQSFDRALALDPTLDWVKARQEEVTRLLKENNVQSQPKDDVQSQLGMHQQDELIGTMLGNYRVLAALGQGGMARVYKAYQENLGRDVAIKVLPPWYAADRSFVERFNLEARLLTSLSHPNIVTVHDANEQNGHLYIAMQLVDGGTFKLRMDKLQSQRRIMEPTEVVSIFSQLADALFYIHERGIVHRNITPANVLMDRSGRPILSGFGLAKVLNSTQENLTRLGAGVGTPAYMSPEQCQGGAIDVRADIYALGVMLFEAQTGRTPFRGNNYPALAHSHIYEAPPSPSSLNANIPPAIENIILKALMKNPQQRFQSANEMKDAINHTLETKQINYLEGAINNDSPSHLYPCFNCQHLNKPQIRYCTRCGYRLNQCQVCGNPNPIGNRFCTKCGRPRAAI